MHRSNPATVIQGSFRVCRLAYSRKYSCSALCGIVLHPVLFGMCYLCYEVLCDDAGSRLLYMSRVTCVHTTACACNFVADIEYICCAIACAQVSDLGLLELELSWIDSDSALACVIKSTTAAD